MAAEASPASAWYAVQTFPKYENVVARSFDRHGVENMNPVIERKVPAKGGGTRLAKQPLFSNYIFIKCRMDAEFREIRERIRGISGILGTKERPTPLPEEEIERIKRLVASDLPIMILEASTITIGQRVRINSGPLEGILGVITAKKHSGRISIVIDAFFGKSVRIDDVDPGILESLDVH